MPTHLSNHMFVQTFGTCTQFLMKVFQFCFSEQTSGFASLECDQILTQILAAFENLVSKLQTYFVLPKRLNQIRLISLCFSATVQWKLAAVVSVLL